MNRRLVESALVLAALTCCAPAFAQTADELVAKNLSARGGAEKLAAIGSLSLKGEMRAPGDFKLAFSELRQRLDPKTGRCAVRIEATIQGLTLIQAYDGKSGWRVNPFEGRKDPEKMGSDESRALADEASIDGALLAAHVMGSRVEYLGREDVDGTDAFELRVSQADGDVFTYFLDPDSYLEIKILERRTIRGSEQETEYELGDYERVGDVYFPFSIASGPKNSRDKQVLTVDSGDANLAVPPGTFDFPGQLPAETRANAPTKSPAPHKNKRRH